LDLRWHGVFSWTQAGAVIEVIKRLKLSGTVYARVLDFRRREGRTQGTQPDGVARRESAASRNRTSYDRAHEGGVELWASAADAATKLLTRSQLGVLNLFSAFSAYWTVCRKPGMCNPARSARPAPAARKWIPQGVAWSDCADASQQIASLFEQFLPITLRVQPV